MRENAIATYRKRRKMTQQELAVKLGLARSTIANYELEDPRQRVIPSVPVLMEMARILKVSITRLLPTAPGRSPDGDGAPETLEHLASHS